MHDRVTDVPERFREGLRLYATEHVEPGRFLRMVLEDSSLNEPIMRIDRDLSIDDLRQLLWFIHCELMPGGCWGNKEKVAAWLALHETHAADADSCKGHIGMVGRWYESQP